MVYFFETPDNLIRVGWSQAPSRRRRDHVNNGFSLRAICPGTGDGAGTAEDAIHSFFKSDRVRPSFYKGKRIFNYVAWLISRGFAATSLEDARLLPVLPFEVWCPEKSGDPFTEQGQTNLFTNGLSGHERIKRASELVHLSSISDEWYTPADVAQSATAALGGHIDLDPASCFQANRIIGAKTYYTKEHSGLEPCHPWRGTIWLNPPYGRGDYSAAKFTSRLISEFKAKNVSAAITCLNVNSACSLWFDDIWTNASVHLVWRGRINFAGPTDISSSPSKGTILSYFGSEEVRFLNVFGARGHAVRTP